VHKIKKNIIPTKNIKANVKSKNITGMRKMVTRRMIPNKLDSSVQIILPTHLFYFGK